MAILSLVLIPSFKVPDPLSIADDDVVWEAELEDVIREVELENVVCEVELETFSWDSGGVSKIGRSAAALRICSAVSVITVSKSADYGTY
jgi:hypothetical protein